MQPDNFQPHPLGHRPPLDDSFRGHAPDIERLVMWRERKRRDFNAGVAEFADCGKCVGNRPLAERLIANCKFHFNVVGTLRVP
jgi:hypothetical protein